MTRTNADEDAFERAIRNDATVKMACGCGHASSYATFESFTDARLDGHIEVLLDGEWAWSLATGRFRATCPTCGGRGKTATLTRQPRDTIILETESALPDHPDREQYFSPTAPLTEKRAKFVELDDDGGPAVEVQCDCGYSDRFLEFSSFEHATVQGDIAFTVESEYIPYALADENFEIECPDCGGVSSNATLYRQGQRVVLVFEIDSAATCPTCNAYVDEAGLQSGPEAPEIGWQYYECPECEARTRPESVGLEAN